MNTKPKPPLGFPPHTGNEAPPPPKPTGDCTCDNASGLHWGKCPINMNTKPTGEWTAERLMKEIGWTPDSRCFEKVAKDINAALAAAKSGGWLSEEALDEYAKIEQEVLQLRKQLDAEQEKCKQADVQLDHHDKVIKTLRKQLAAEREKLREERAKFHGDDYADMNAARNRILDLEQQLDAERERYRVEHELQNALEKVKEEK